MHWYTIQETLTHTDHPPQPETPAVVLLTSEELDHHPTLPGLETVLLHTPSAQDAKVCKADVRWDCLSGTLVLPRQEKDEGRTTYGYLIAQNRVVLVDDGDTVPGLLRHIVRQNGVLLQSTTLQPFCLSDPECLICLFKVTIHSVKIPICLPDQMTFDKPVLFQFLL